MSCVVCGKEVVNGVFCRQCNSYHYEIHPSGCGPSVFVRGLVAKIEYRKEGDSHSGYCSDPYDCIDFKEETTEYIYLLPMFLVEAMDENNDALSYNGKKYVKDLTTIPGFLDMYQFSDITDGGHCSFKHNKIILSATLESERRDQRKTVSRRKTRPRSRFGRNKGEW